MFRLPRSIDLTWLGDAVLGLAAAAYLLGFLACVEIALSRLFY